MKGLLGVYGVGREVLGQLNKYTVQATQPLRIILENLKFNKIIQLKLFQSRRILYLINFNECPAGNIRISHIYLCICGNVIILISVN